jgi:hypothetical protein
MGWLLITGVSLGKAAMMPRIFWDKAKQHLKALASPCGTLGIYTPCIKAWRGKSKSRKRWKTAWV